MANRPAFVAVQKGNPRGSGYTRAADDFYTEPASAVRALLSAEKFFGLTLDPACGKGTIPKAFAEYGRQAIGTDLVDRGFGVSPINYLDFGPDPAVVNIVTNPPYNLAEAFALKAIGEAQHKVAMLLRLAWLESRSRHLIIFKPHPPARVLVFTNRISCTPGNSTAEAKGGAVPYAWFIWNKDARGPTQLDWITAQ